MFSFEFLKSSLSIDNNRYLTQTHSLVLNSQEHETRKAIKLVNKSFY